MAVIDLDPVRLASKLGHGVDEISAALISCGIKPVSWQAGRTGWVPVFKLAVPPPQELGPPPELPPGQLVSLADVGRILDVGRGVVSRKVRQMGLVAAHIDDKGGHWLRREDGVAVVASLHQRRRKGPRVHS